MTFPGILIGPIAPAGSLETAVSVTLALGVCCLAASLAARSKLRALLPPLSSDSFSLCLRSCATFAMFTGSRSYDSRNPISRIIFTQRWRPLTAFVRVPSPVMSIDWN
jgi:hypothetical protein